jgi:glutathione S-transferase
MKLFYTPTSPYARKTRVAAIEAGIDDRVEFVKTTVRDPASPLYGLNPVGMVPTLQTDDGDILSESAIICDFFMSLEGARPLVPVRAKERLQVLALESMARGFLEGVAVWARALRAPTEMQYVPALENEKARAVRCLDYFESRLDGPNFQGGVNLAQITLGCALGVLDFRVFFFDWRISRPALEAWHETFAARPSMRATAPHE